MKRRVLIFTDLDGSLLDHDSYSFEGALPALARIKESDVTLVLTTSKTRVEIEALQTELGIRDPFIAENGAAIYFPASYSDFLIEDGVAVRPPYLVIVLGRPYSEIRRFLDTLKRRFPVKGFGDLSTDDVARLTGLPEEKAQWARQREYTEPFVLEDLDRLDEIDEWAKREGLKVTAGGRFHHLISANQDKGLAVVKLKEILAAHCPGGVVTVALGDSPNDLMMLESVDIPILIPQSGGQYQEVSLPRLRKAGKPGSRGWNESVERVLDELQKNTG
ncbi:MAG TPA: HAD-IIB family hydrolase [Syntrophales bacterium]|nr:HAD-IIB family hydrolase [Syntrophales bacterium]HPI58426.1 HAD-IIB family hydrolase [Syntrophales bacterium]HPN23771.1 HAD-IIB family hydrolase [Syntrophales bacterium]HQM30158.1 HAD-IIB family hydrolase [Syntrophales bacterium]